MRPFRRVLPLLLAGLVAPLAHATRYFWILPGTAGMPFGTVLWHRPSGTLLAASGHRILGIDPLRGDAQTIMSLVQTGPDGKPVPAATVLDFTLGPGGTLDFLLAPSGQTVSDGRIFRRNPDGRIVQIAALRSTGPGGGETKAHHPVALVTHPGTGALAVAGPYTSTCGRVDLLLPKPVKGAPGAAGMAGFDLIHAAGEDIRALDGDDLAIDEASDPEVAYAENALIDPKGLALGPGGELLVADADLERICRLIPRPAEAGGGYRLEALPYPEEERTGEEDWTVDEEAEGLRLVEPHQVALGDDGTTWVLAKDLVWSFSSVPNPGPGPSRIWRVVAGRVDGGGPWSPGAVPALQVHEHSIGALKHMAAGPRGTLLFTDGKDGIRVLGPEGDADLVARVQAHRQAEAVEDWPKVQRIWRALMRQRSQGLAQPVDTPFRTLCRDATVHASLNADVLDVIGKFLVEPGWIAFRATLALEAIKQESPFQQAQIRAANQFAVLALPAAPEAGQGVVEPKN